MMFKKVLIAEDMDSINEGLNTTLFNLGVVDIHHAKYCDDALLKVKRAKLDGVPFDLLISDLSFIKDHREQQLTSGDELVAAVKKELPQIKTIIYSIEDRASRIQDLVNNIGVDAFVCKGRNGLVELKKAVGVVYSNESYISLEIAHALRNNQVLEINDYDVSVLTHLSEGFSQDQITVVFKSKNMIPFSLSAIEKRISKLKVYFKASNTIHLIALTKDIGII